MVIPPTPPAYTRLLIKKNPTDMVISNFAKKSGGDKYTPPPAHLQYLQCHLDLQKR